MAKTMGFGRSDDKRATQGTRSVFANESSLPKLEDYELELYPWFQGAITYSERYGSLVQNARFWRTGCLLLVVAVVALTFGIVAIAGQAKVVPYVVQVDEHGYAIAVKPAEQVSPVDERVVISQVARWVRAQRSVLGDLGAQRELVEDVVFKMLAPNTPANQKTREYFTQNDPYVVSSKRVDVEITRVQPMKSASHVTVDWVERTRDGNVTESVTRYSALIAVSVAPVRALDDVIANPLGVFVTDYSISQL